MQDKKIYMSNTNRHSLSKNDEHAREVAKVMKQVPAKQNVKMCGSKI